MYELSSGYTQATGRLEETEEWSYGSCAQADNIMCLSLISVDVYLLSPPAK